MLDPDIMALAGAGIASLSDFLTRTDVAAGRPVPVLEAAALVDFLARRLQEVLEPCMMFATMRA